MIKLVYCWLVKKKLLVIYIFILGRKKQRRLMSAGWWSMPRGEGRKGGILGGGMGPSRLLFKIDNFYKLFYAFILILDNYDIILG